MKYKLISKTTDEEHLCDKVTIDGFDYYVNDEEIKDGFYTDSEDLFEAYPNNIPLQPTEDFKKVIATNNSNIDISQIIEEPNETLIHQIAADLGYRMLPDDLEEGIKAGYKESQETHPFSEEDMIEFHKWLSKNDWQDYSDIKEGLFVNTYGVQKQDKELLKIWQEQRPKIVYYE